MIVAQAYVAEAAEARGNGNESKNIGIRGRESGQWLAARRLKVRLRSVCDAGRQCDGARALGLFNDEQRAETLADAFYRCAIGKYAIGKCAIGASCPRRRACPRRCACAQRCTCARRRAYVRRGAEGVGNGLELSVAAAVPLHMNIIDWIMFLVILAGFGLGLAYFGGGFRAIRETKRQR